MANGEFSFLGFAMENGEFLEAIIHRIQSFLTPKAAARTAILSKSWNSAWLTRPNLEFDQRDFSKRSAEEFSEFARKTMQRYEELNLKIEILRLYMENATQMNSASLANELIVKAMKMGATHLDFQLSSATPTYVLPHEVLECETLIGLLVNGCKIDPVVDGKVICARLKSLCLHRVYIEGDMNWDIGSSCPFLEMLVLSECMCLPKVFPRGPNNLLWGIEDGMMTSTTLIEFGRQIVGSDIDSPIKLYEFDKLTGLSLVRSNLDPLFYVEFSSKFPCLKVLSLMYCYGYEAMQISSCSLEYISIAHRGMLRAEFDVPSIRKFSFSGWCLPSLSIKTAGSGWKFHMSMTCDSPSTSWFLELKDLLREFSQSRISLQLEMGDFSEKSFDRSSDVQDLSRPVVENLKLFMLPRSAVCSAHLDGLFWSCRPKFISGCWLPKSWMGLEGNFTRDLLELLCKALVQEVSDSCSYTPNRNMFVLHDLEEVNVQLFERSLGEWHPLPFKTVFDASAIPENLRKIVFQLRWGPEPSTFK